MVSQNQWGRVMSQEEVDKYAFTFDGLWSRVKSHGESCDDWDERLAYALCAFICTHCCVPALYLTAPRPSPNR